MDEIITNKIKNLNIKWDYEPFPHTVIDNFLPSNNFKKISENLKLINNFKDLKKNFSTHVEFNKKVYGDKDLSGELKIPVNILGSKLIKNIFEKFLNVKNMISLADWENYGGYYPFHSMNTGGVLGAHVDHSHSEDDLLHVANAIYYVSDKWDESWGGETFFSNDIGTKIVKKIIPKPNRLVLFIHSSQAFHGVNKISSPSDIKRNTYYMDYYIKDSEFIKMIDNQKKNIGKSLNYTHHTTTFIPLFPIGLKSFEIKFLGMKNTYKYILKYMQYLIARFIFGYQFSGFLKKLFTKKN